MPMEDELSQNVNNKLNELFHLPQRNAARILSANTKDISMVHPC